MFSRTYAVAANVALSVTVLPNANFGDLTALLPSAFFSAATWAFSSVVAVFRNAVSCLSPWATLFFVAAL